MSGWSVAGTPRGVVDEGGSARQRRSLLTSDAPVAREPFVPAPFSPLQLPPLQVDFTQAEARRERHQGFIGSTHYLVFDAVAEVREQAGPLVGEIRELLGTPPVFREDRADEVAGVVSIAPGFYVVRLAQAVHRARIKLAEVLARVPSSPEVRERLAAVVRDPAQQRRPEISDEVVRSGAWLDVLVAHIEPVSEILAPVVASRPQGRVTEVDAGISAALGGPEGFDQAVRDLRGRVEVLRRVKRDWRRRERRLAAQEAQRERQRVEDSLRRMGLT